MVAALQRVLFVLGLLVVVGCATGGRADGGPPPTRDSGMGGYDAGRPSSDGGYRLDAYVRPDGGSGFDAGIVRTDAGVPIRDSGGLPGLDGGIGFMCMSTADCVSMPGTCCLAFMGSGLCVPGMEMFGFCNPF